jgi:hypothetical protein
MTVVCSNGHPSATADYCDQCGVLIAKVSAGEQTEILSVVDDDDTSAVAPDEPCPGCGTMSHGDGHFCECCGYDFRTSSMPNNGSSEGVSGVAGAAVEPVVWEAVVRADREQLERFGDEGLDFPDAWEGLTVALVARAVRIGRNCEQAEAHEQKIELSGPPLDPGMSREHAMLERHSDGVWEVRDLGSTNGTWINAELAPLAGARRLQDGDRIGLGAWTMIEIRAREP